MTTNTVKIENKDDFGQRSVVLLFRNGNKVANKTFRPEQSEKMTEYINKFLNEGTTF